MLIKKLKRIYHRRKAVSPIVATLLLIALVVAASAAVFIIYYKLIRKSNITASVTEIKDTNKDSQYDEITLLIANTGTLVAEIYNITIWTTTTSYLGNQDLWVVHKNWNFTNPGQATIMPSEVIYAEISGDEQISLTFWEYTYYKLELFYTASKNPLITDWLQLNEYADLSDILLSFESFNLTANGFDGTIDDPNRAANNYVTNDDGDYQLSENAYNYLPVLDELESIPFYIGTQIVVFHSPNGNLSLQPLQQAFDTSANPFRASKLFALGLTGSWGDAFTYGDWALNLTFVYTDDSMDSYLLNHSYIDDWWYGSNPGNICISAPDGLITEIDLGTQADTPHSHIHTHSTRFFMDYFKYVKAIIFTDPGDDASAPHLLSLTLR
ncbi:MAG: archaellin/type IV pilin N-terminal domain-containing protein [Candidatus Heimdallarchaeota archaeon]